jgi:hypothetical protein
MREPALHPQSRPFRGAFPNVRSTAAAKSDDRSVRRGLSVRTVVRAPSRTRSPYEVGREGNDTSRFNM